MRIGFGGFGRISESWKLTKASWAVLRADRELLLFPFFSFLALVVVLISFLIPAVALYPELRDPVTGNPTALIYVGLFLFYVVAYTVMFFFNTGLVGAAMIRLNGGDPTVRDGFRVAIAHLPTIIGYAIIAATVGMLLRYVAERAGIVGRILVTLLGVAWSMLTYLVVPVFVVENVGPVAALRRSRDLLRKTWGEQLVGGAGIGLVFGLLAFAAFAVGVGIIGLVAKSSQDLAMLVFVATILVVGVISLFGAALSGIFHASLYRFATTGESGAFDADAMSDAFAQRAVGLGGMLRR
jgi:hypothetical protein